MGQTLNTSYTINDYLIEICRKISGSEYNGASSKINLRESDICIEMAIDNINAGTDSEYVTNCGKFN